MQILSGIQEIGPFAGGVVSIGNFDGVHRGHRVMLKELVRLAEKLNVPAVAITFDPPPVALIAPQRVPPRLTTSERKAELMSELGVDALLVYRTNREFLNLSPAEFFQQVVLDQLQAKGLVEGENFCFGKNRAGNSQLLGEFCQEHQLELKIVSPVLNEGEVISSTGIRYALAQGDFAKGVNWLGKAYGLTGTVVSGAKRGRILGFPTANLDGISTLIPQEGIYAGLSWFDGKPVGAAVHIGKIPTFDDDSVRVEVYLLDFEADLYGQSVSVDLFARIREIKRFDSSESLKLQLQQDVEQVRNLVETRLAE